MVQTMTDHVHYFRVYILCDDTTLSSDVFQHLMQSLGFDLFSLELRASIVKIKQYTALVNLLDE